MICPKLHRSPVGQQEPRPDHQPLLCILLLFTLLSKYPPSDASAPGHFLQKALLDWADYITLTLSQSCWAGYGCVSCLSAVHISYLTRQRSPSEDSKCECSPLPA